ncbi:hypothetical protein Agabi119p4_4288 [Agaricus bisporus var. burnettii]|uniref:C2H2-type domain-containing protein n=1 Tax=Agaricus bisporus var. burnettii TaxID=192524 RepID=A0A8H7F2V9_AGABI|nr:hypothetical protein Agabi119p4_4288 [Agaricus bisporus var. burnettii]
MTSRNSTRGIDLELASFLDEPGQEEDDFGEEDPISLMFSGEEAYGKYCDLYANHVAYTNLKGIDKRPAYLQYLDLLLPEEGTLVHQDIPKDTRFSRQYESYIKDLYKYLLSFTKRTQPLMDVESQQNQLTLQFEQKWDAKELPEWDDVIENAPINGNGIWCAACQKHYAKQTVYDAHLSSKKHIKAMNKQAAAGEPPKNPNGSPMPEMLHTIRTWPRPYWFSLTAREREQELLDQANPPPPAAAAKDGAAEEEEEEERIYNPLKLPLGWDGKPIPYWLYKLHGLGVEYRCEICSDHVYMGRKNFDRHFQESRHAFGMRALGLPNTKHFHEITRIEDALALAEKLKQEGRHEIFEQETMEELEDTEGNVYNRKTYEDLKKQGLI